MPKPVLTILDFSSALASSDLGADELENEFMMNNLQLSEVNPSFCMFMQVSLSN
jgi:chromosome transmission fidelity protein 4